MYLNQGLLSYYSPLNCLSNASSPNPFLGHETRFGEIDLVLSSCLITDAFDKESVCFSCLEGHGLADARSVCDVLEDEVLLFLA